MRTSPDYKKGKASRLSAEGYEYKLDGFGCRLFLLTPVFHGWAVIGRPDKYLSPETAEPQKFTADAVELTMHEPVAILLYSAKGQPSCEGWSFTDKGDGFYLAEPGKGVKPDAPIRIRR